MYSDPCRMQILALDDSLQLIGTKGLQRIGIGTGANDLMLDHSARPKAPPINPCSQG